LQGFWFKINSMYMTLNNENILIQKINKKYFFKLEFLLIFS